MRMIEIRIGSFLRMGAEGVRRHEKDMGNPAGRGRAVDILIEVLGSFLTAISLYNFALPAAFPMTGFSGVALILYRLFGLPIGVMTLC